MRAHMKKKQHVQHLLLLGIGITQSLLLVVFGVVGATKNQTAKAVADTTPPVITFQMDDADGDGMVGPFAALCDDAGGGSGCVAVSGTVTGRYNSGTFGSNFDPRACRPWHGHQCAFLDPQELKLNTLFQAPGTVLGWSFDFQGIDAAGNVSPVYHYDMPSAPVDMCPHRAGSSSNYGCPVDPMTATTVSTTMNLVDDDHDGSPDAFSFTCTSPVGCDSIGAIGLTYYSATTSYSYLAWADGVAGEYRCAYSDEDGETSCTSPVHHFADFPFFNNPLYLYNVNLNGSALDLYNITHGWSSGAGVNSNINYDKCPSSSGTNSGCPAPDLNPPNVSISTTDMDGDGYPDSTMFSCTDDHGCASITYSLNGGAPVTYACDGGPTCTIPNISLGAGAYSVVFSAKDINNNTSANQTATGMADMCPATASTGNLGCPAPIVTAQPVDQDHDGIFDQVLITCSSPTVEDSCITVQYNLSPTSTGVAQSGTVTCDPGQSACTALVSMAPGEYILTATGIELSSNSTQFTGDFASSNDPCTFTNCNQDTIPPVITSAFTDSDGDGKPDGIKVTCTDNVACAFVGIWVNGTFPNDPPANVLACTTQPCVMMYSLAYLAGQNIQIQLQAVDTSNNFAVPINTSVTVDACPTEAGNGADGCPTAQQANASKLKKDTISALTALTTSDRSSGKELAAATLEITQSLGAQVTGGDKQITWLTDDTLDCKFGFKVFDHEKLAVEHLQHVTDPALTTAVNKAIAALVDADLQISKVKLAASTSDPRYQAALSDFNSANSEIDPKLKIQDYRTAWKAVCN